MSKLTTENFWDLANMLANLKPKEPDLDLPFHLPEYQTDEWIKVKAERELEYTEYEIKQAMWTAFRDQTMRVCRSSNSRFNSELFKRACDPDEYSLSNKKNILKAARNMTTLSNKEAKEVQCFFDKKEERLPSSRKQVLLGSINCKEGVKTINIARNDKGWFLY